MSIIFLQLLNNLGGKALKSESIDLFALCKLVENIKENITEGETLGLKQIDTLLVLLKHKNISITNIANQLNVSPPAVSTLTEKLMIKGLIQRTYNHVDRRVVKVNLSENGKILANALQNKQETIRRNIEEPLTKDEIHTFNMLLNKMTGSNL
jgi:DNA-binding MarR family transcriptional regulator